MSKTNKESGVVGAVLRMYADLAMIFTTRHSQRGAIPLIMLRYAYKSVMEGDMEDITKGKTFLKKFNCSGDGLFFTYKLCCEGGKQYKQKPVLYNSHSKAAENKNTEHTKKLLM